MKIIKVFLFAMFGFVISCSNEDSITPETGLHKVTVTHVDSDSTDDPDLTRVYYFDDISNSTPPEAYHFFGKNITELKWFGGIDEITEYYMFFYGNLGNLKSLQLYYGNSLDIGINYHHNSNGIISELVASNQAKRKLIYNEENKLQEIRDFEQGSDDYSDIYQFYYNNNGYVSHAIEIDKRNDSTFYYYTQDENGFLTKFCRLWYNGYNKLDTLEVVNLSYNADGKIFKRYLKNDAFEYDSYYIYTTDGKIKKIIDTSESGSEYIKEFIYDDNGLVIEEIVTNAIGDIERRIYNYE